MNYVFSLLEHFGLWFGFLLVVIENIGIPFPIEIVYLYSQHLLMEGQSSFWLMLLYFTGGHLTGCIIGYFLGYWSNNFVARRFQKSKKLTKARQTIERWYAKYGSVTNLLTRLIGYVRPWSSLVAGFGKENFWIFLGWSALGTVIFNVLAILIASSILSWWESYHYAKFIIAAGFLFFFLGIWLFLPSIVKRFKI